MLDEQWHQTQSGGLENKAFLDEQWTETQRKEEIQENRTFLDGQWAAARDDVKEVRTQEFLNQQWGAAHGPPTPHDNIEVVIPQVPAATRDGERHNTLSLAATDETSTKESPDLDLGEDGVEVRTVSTVEDSCTSTSSSGLRRNQAQLVD